MAQDLHPVDTMLTILMDTSNRTLINNCGDSSDLVFLNMKASIQHLLDDPEVIPRDGRLVLGIMWYGGPPPQTLGGCDEDNYEPILPYPYFIRITSETDVDTVRGVSYRL